eukprot:15449970-Alexandrium_andersonii.AAC.1
MTRHALSQIAWAALLCSPEMLQAALVRRGLIAFVVVSLLHYVETRSLSVQGLSHRLRPAGLGLQLVLGGACRL